MLSTPRSLGFVLAAILGAMLVPGCRPGGLSGAQLESGRPGQSGDVGRNARSGLDGVWLELWRTQNPELRPMVTEAERRLEAPATAK